MSLWKRFTHYLRTVAYSNVRVVKPFYVTFRVARGYMQIGYKPAKFFAIKMTSGRLGIMQATNIQSYSDFGQTCYHVEFRLTGSYLNSERKVV